MNEKSFYSTLPAGFSLFFAVLCMQAVVIEHAAAGLGDRLPCLDPGGRTNSRLKSSAPPSGNGGGL